jgi:hypothetical protein
MSDQQNEQDPVTCHCEKLKKLYWKYEGKLNRLVRAIDVGSEKYTVLVLPDRIIRRETMDAELRLTIFSHAMKIIKKEMKRLNCPDPYAFVLPIEE